MEIETYLKIIFCFGIVVLGSYHFVKLYLDIRCGHTWKFLHEEDIYNTSVWSYESWYNTTQTYTCINCGKNKKWKSPNREQRDLSGEPLRLKGTIK